MFKHVLVYTDGSKLSRKALVTGIKIAKMASGRITLLYVLPRLDPMIFAEGYVPEPETAPRPILNGLKCRRRNPVCPVPLASRLPTGRTRKSSRQHEHAIVMPSSCLRADARG